MSTKANAQLMGQDNPESKETVAAQRELKKKKDALRKLASKLKNAAEESEKNRLKDEIIQTEAEILALEQLLKPAVEQVSEPPSVEATQVSATMPSVDDAPQDSVSAARAALMGQDTEEKRAQVAAQRELKKKKDALKKLASKLKIAKADGKHDEEALILEDIQRTELEISVLEKESVAHGAVQHVAVSSTAADASTKPSPAAQAAATVVVATATDSAQVSVKPVVPKPAALAPPQRATGLLLPLLAAFDTASPLAASTGGTPNAAHERPLPRQSSPPRNSVAGSLASLSLTPDYSSVVHPRAAETGLLMQAYKLVGGNARTIALLDIFQELAKSSEILNVPVLTSEARTKFEELVNENFRFVASCRDPCVGMKYAKVELLRRLKRAVIVNAQQRSTDGMSDAAPSSPVTSVAPAAFHSRSLPASAARFAPEPPLDFAAVKESAAAAASGFVGTARDVVLSLIDEIRNEIYCFVHRLVEERAQQHITDGDCILTYGRSSAVELVLQYAASQKKVFRVIVVDCAPLFEGRNLALRLQRMGVEVTYGLLTSVCTLLPKCTKVLIGASAVLQSGEVYSRAGTATVATSAKCFRKPVLCLSESYKFVSKVWLGSLVQNSVVSQQRRPIGTSDVMTIPCNVSTSDSERNAASYLYDLTPSSSIDMIVSDIDCLHTSAIAAAIRDRMDQRDRI